MSFAMQTPVQVTLGRWCNNQPETTQIYSVEHNRVVASFLENVKTPPLGWLNPGENYLSLPIPFTTRMPYHLKAILILVRPTHPHRCLELAVEYFSSPKICLFINCVARYATELGNSSEVFNRGVKWNAQKDVPTYLIAEIDGTIAADQLQESDLFLKKELLCKGKLF